MITDRDMRDQVIQTLGDEAHEFRIDGIVDEIQRRYGTVHVDKVPDGIYGEIVARHNY